MLFRMTGNTKFFRGVIYKLYCNLIHGHRYRRNLVLYIGWSMYVCVCVFVCLCVVRESYLDFIVFISGPWTKKVQHKHIVVVVVVLLHSQIIAGHKLILKRNCDESMQMTVSVLMPVIQTNFLERR